MRSTASKVYLIRYGETDIHKIGESHDPERRLAQLQTACPTRLSLVATIPGGKAKEAELHGEYADRCVRGEWFRITRPEVEFLASGFTDGVRQAIHRQRFIHPDICYLLTRALEFSVVIAWGERSFVAPEIDGGNEVYQVMRQREGPGRGKVFWDWYLWERPQWFADPADAAATFLENWHEWIDSGKSPN